MLKINGIVQTGFGAGRKLGWPTANIGYTGATTLPTPGIYAGFATVGGKRYGAAIVVGARVENPPLVEAHLIDFDGDLVGKTLDLEIVKHVSNMQKCDTEAELKQKIDSDMRLIKKILCLPAS